MAGVMRWLSRCLLGTLLALLPAAAGAETPLLRIGIQPGMSYLAMFVMEKEGLIEKRAAAAGQALKVEWIVSANGTVITDGVLSGGIDMAGTGIPTFVQLWAKGRNTINIRGISSYGSIPGMLVSRNPNIHSIKDFTAADRIAVPSVKTSVQAMLLAMLAEKTFGPGGRERLDPFTVSLSHPDGMVAILSGHSEINTHFTTSPYYQMELKQPGVHAVLTKADIFPGPLSNGVLWTTQKFHDGNPNVLRAVRDGLRDAIALVHGDPLRAAEDYLSLSKEKLDAADIAAIIREVDEFWETVPHGVFPIASFMARAGMLKTPPARWQDMFFEEGWVDGGS